MGFYRTLQSPKWALRNPWRKKEKERKKRQKSTMPSQLLVSTDPVRYGLFKPGKWPNCPPSTNVLSQKPDRDCMCLREAHMHRSLKLLIRFLLLLLNTLSAVIQDVAAEIKDSSFCMHIHNKRKFLPQSTYNRMDMTKAVKEKRDEVSCFRSARAAPGVLHTGCAAF